MIMRMLTGLLRASSRQPYTESYYTARCVMSEHQLQWWLLGMTSSGLQLQMLSELYHLVNCNSKSKQLLLNMPVQATQHLLHQAKRCGQQG